MVVRQYLGFADYVVICFSLIISTGIGIYKRIHGKQENTASEYLLAGRKMTKIPVICSVIVTLISPASILSVPAEIYLYGFQFTMFSITLPIGMYLASLVFIPVYYQCGVSTVNEYLEIRFGRIIKFIVSALFLVQMVFLIVTSLLGAVLAISAVTNLSLEMAIVSIGVVCTFYCSLGGLKGVLWTDCFQAFLIFVTMISIYIAGIDDAGGILNIYQRAKVGKRLEFDFSLDFTKRISFWASSFRGLTVGFAVYGTNQIEVQRILSLSTVERAKSTLQLSIFPATLSFLSTNFLGLLFYSIHYLCDPVLNKDQTGLNRYDQILPAFLVERFHSIPGLSGLCIAGIFSAALSTISSALNSVSTVTVVDFIKPLVKNGSLSDARVVVLAKILSVLYGGISIGLSFCFLEVKSLIQLLIIIVTGLEGPLLAVFLTGVLSRKCGDKSISFAFLTGYLLIATLGFSSLFSKYKEEPLTLSTIMCSPQDADATSHWNNSFAPCLNNSACFNSHPTSYLPKTETFILYKISFLWYSTIGFAITSILIFLTVIITGWKNDVISSDSKCLSPITCLWTKVQKCDRELNENKTEDKMVVQVAEHYN